MHHGRVGGDVDGIEIRREAEAVGDDAVAPVGRRAPVAAAGRVCPDAAGGMQNRRDQHRSNSEAANNSSYDIISWILLKIHSLNELSRIKQSLAKAHQ